MKFKVRLMIEQQFIVFAPNRQVAVFLAERDFNGINDVLVQRLSNYITSITPSEMDE